MIRKLKKLNAKKVKAKSSWPEDFYTLLVRGMPSEFKECGNHMRGLYVDNVIGKWYMKPTVHLERNTYLIELDKFSLKEEWTLKDAVVDMLQDINRIAKQYSYTKVKTPEELVPKTYVIGTKGAGLMLVAQN